MTETADIATAPPSPWVPERDPIRLAILSKLAEELGECSSAVGRCISQGISEGHPATGKLNRVWLEDEIADIMAWAATATRILRLDNDHITERSRAKIRYGIQWLEMLSKRP